MRMQTKVKIKTSKVSGRGVFATADIKPGTLIEVSPVILFDVKHEKQVDKTSIRDYYYGWSRTKNALALGVGSLFNHSYSANADYCMDYKNNAIRYYAKKNIKKGEEIFINYCSSQNPNAKLWFN